MDRAQPESMLEAPLYPDVRSFKLSVTVLERRRNVRVMASERKGEDKQLRLRLKVRRSTIDEMSEARSRARSSITTRFLLWNFSGSQFSNREQTRQPAIDQ